MVVDDSSDRLDAGRPATGSGVRGTDPGSVTDPLADPGTDPGSVTDPGTDPLADPGSVTDPGTDPSSHPGSVTDPGTSDPIPSSSERPIRPLRWSSMLLGLCGAAEIAVLVVGVLTGQPGVAALLVVAPVAASAVASVPVTGAFAVAAAAGAIGLGWVHGWSPVAQHALVTAGVVVGSGAAVVVAAVRAREEVALVAALRGRDRERRRRRAAEVRNRLHRLAAALAATSSVADVADTTFATLRSTMGAAAGLLGLVEHGADGEDRTVRFRQSFGYRPGLTDRWPMVPLNPDMPSTAVVVTQRAIFTESADAFARRWPRVAEDVADSKLEALCLLPLVVSARSVGFLTVSWAHRRRFSDEERRFLQALADQCAQALERARLAEAERRARRRLAFLGDVTRLLTSLLDPVAVTDRLVDLVVGSMADACAVLVPRGSMLERRAGASRGRMATTVLDQLVGNHGVPMDSDGPVAEAWRIGQAVARAFDQLHLAVTPAAHGARDPSGGRPIVLAVPLAAGGERLGVMVFLSGLDTAPFATDDVSMAREVAARASTALHNATRFQHERNLADLLQQALLPEALPAVPGLLLDAAYRAGTAGTVVGGDWFDAIALEDGRVLVSVGDVMGKGASAAALMSQVRSAIRAYGVADPRPSVVLAQLDQLVDTVGDGRLVTAVIAVVDPSARRVQLASAGHLAPLVVGPGRLEVLDTPQRRILGARVPPVASARRGASVSAGAASGLGPARDAAGSADAVAELGPADTLILYSDGLVERREEPITAGIARLGECASRCANGPGWPARAASLLVEALAIGDGVDDDVVVLTVGMAGSPTEADGSPGSSSIHSSASARDSLPRPADPLGVGVSGKIVLAAEVASASAARKWLGDLLRDYPADQRSRAQLLVGELVANAVLHADTEVSVGVQSEGALVHVEVADRSVIPPVAKHFAPDASTGRGLLLVRRLSSAWGVVGHDAGKVVWFEVGVEEPSSLVDPTAAPAVVDLGSWPTLDALAHCDTAVVRELGPTVPVVLLGAPVHLAVSAAAYYDELTRELNLAVDARRVAAAPAARQVDEPPASSPTLEAVPPASSPTLEAVPPASSPTLEAVPPASSPTLEELVAASAQITPGGLPMIRALAMADEQWAEALVAGSELFDLRVQIAEHVTRQGAAVDRALDELQEWSRRGAVLAVPAPDDVVAFRRWIIGEITGQYAGRPPTRWHPPAADQ